MLNFFMRRLHKSCIRGYLAHMPEGGLQQMEDNLPPRILKAAYDMAYTSYVVKLKAEGSIAKEVWVSDGIADFAHYLDAAASVEGSQPCAFWADMVFEMHDAFIKCGAYNRPCSQALAY